MSQLLNTSSRPRDLWSDFWFAPSSPYAAARVRIGFGFVLALYFLTWLPDITKWYGDNGILGRYEIAQLLLAENDEQPRWLRLSPLFQTGNPNFLTGYLLLGVGASLLVTFGFGGRWLIAIAWILLLGLVHRGPMLIGLAEPVLSLLGAYLIVDPGKLKSPFRPGMADCENRFTATLATRLIQVHLFGVLVLGFLSKTSVVAWWQGEAVWALAAEGHSPIWSLPTLGQSVFLVNFLTHLIVALEGLTLALIWPKNSRRAGILLGWAAQLLVILCTDQLLYPLALCVGLLAFFFETHNNRNQPG